MTTATATVTAILALLATSLAAPSTAAGPHSSGTATERGTEQQLLTATASAVRGRGYGHGRGMSQYGAQGAAMAGRSAKQILDFYYPGTTTGRAVVTLRVRIAGDTTDGLRVPAATNLRVRDLSSGKAWILPRSATKNQWSLDPYGDHGTRLRSYDARTRTWAAWRSSDGRTSFKSMAQFEGPAVIPLILPDNRRIGYRGILRTSDTAGAHLDTVNHVFLEAYLRGVVALESPASWRAAALEAQTVAARTYAVFNRRLAGARGYDLCDTTACQVYGGYAAEATRTNAAIAATAGQTRLYRGRSINAEFSASNGGATVAGPAAYQVAKPDAWDGYRGNRNPYVNWSVATTAAKLRILFGVGALRSVKVTARTGLGPWGGRVLTVEGVGTAGRKVLSGDQVRLRLGLKSNWFLFG